ncbi:MAG: single-stranded DNA-binding protein [Sphaerochaetaceae bacterium]|nr:single-stranded DNA-binding protein [Sphaerochaetaceae bacterium]
MNNLNNVILEGKLTRDPDLIQLTANNVGCRLSIANNRYFLNKSSEWKQETSFFIVNVYGKVADSCLKFLKKGRGIRVVGRLKQERWKDNGIPKDNISVIAEHIEFQPLKTPLTKEPLEEIEEDNTELTIETTMVGSPELEQENEEAGTEF